MVELGTSELRPKHADLLRDRMLKEVLNLGAN